MVWCSPLFMVEGPGQLHADLLGMAAVAAGMVFALRGRLPTGWLLYALAVLGKYTYAFAWPWFWLVGAEREGGRREREGARTGEEGDRGRGDGHGPGHGARRSRAVRLVAMGLVVLAVGALVYAPFWRGMGTLIEPVRALGGMNPGGSIVEIVGHLVHVARGGAVPPASLPPQVAIEVERAAKGPTWAAVALVLRVVFVGVVARQLYGMLRRRADPEALALGTGAIVVAAITLFSHRFQSWYLMAALPFFGLRCEGAWRRWWPLVVGFSVATEFIHVLPRTAALLPVWSVVTNGAVVVVFLLWFRERFLRLEPAPEQAPGPAASSSR
jgi:hypothetical protein